MRHYIDSKEFAGSPVCFFQYAAFIVFMLLLYCIYAICGSASVVLAHGDSITVQINGLAQPPGLFPDFLTLHVNDTVVFVNHTNSSYTLSADDGNFTSPPIGPGEQWKVTFISKGAHVYRDNASPQRTVGELLVVDSSVQLLPTPNALVEATVIATIKDRKNPPDSIILPVMARPASTASSSFISIIIMIVIISGAMIILGTLGFAYYQRYQQRIIEPDEDQTGPLPLNERIQQTGKTMDDLKKKLQVHFSLHKNKLDDDEDDWDELP